MSDEDVDPEDIEDEDLDEDLDDEVLDEALDEELDEELDELDAPAESADAATAGTDDEDDEDDDEVPRAKARPGTEDDEDDDVNPDDIEADLDSILKDKIASGDEDDEDDDDEEAPAPTKDASEKVAAKAADEFTCNTCFLIVHPRQFGRLGNLSCPEGYDPCPSIEIVEQMLKKARKS